MYVHGERDISHIFHFTPGLALAFSFSLLIWVNSCSKCGVFMFVVLFFSSETCLRNVWRTPLFETTTTLTADTLRRVLQDCVELTPNTGRTTELAETGLQTLQTTECA